MIDDLTGPEAYPNLKGKKILESKKSMRTRGLASPGKGDSCALTFAHPVKKKNDILPEKKEFAKSEYDVLSGVS